MGIIITLLTLVMVLDCLLLILLVLIQLPKKETGAGLAFGGGATDALFGSGSGNVVTKVTKYCAGIFLGLAMLLSVLNINHNAAKRGSEGLRKELDKAARTPVPQAQVPQPKQVATTAATNVAPLLAPGSLVTPSNAPSSTSPVPAPK
ncbi:MAG TPA: preprotein translocase subunit SecG [Verrucomicrobiae bacterium]|jgi:preprotein translocase subunit SecG